MENSFAMRRIRLHGWHVLALVGTALALGCSQDAGPETYSVTGKVIQNNQPVEGASVSFAPAGDAGSAAAGKTDASGQYTVNAVPGDYTVTIVKYESAADSGGEDLGMETAEYEAAQAGAEAEQDQQDSSSGNRLPAKYADPATSGFTHTVKEEDSTFDLNLEG